MLLLHPALWQVLDCGESLRALGGGHFALVVRPNVVVGEPEGNGLADLERFFYP